MNKLKLFSVCLCFTIFGALVLVESKVQLCHPPPNWTINNGTDPMRESLGNVTLLTLLNASYHFGLKQALSMENMYRFLKSTGLKEFNFIIINSNDLGASQKLKEISDQVSFAVYQESDNEKVWDVLDGGKDDMFIYDRCGLLTYYIPFPLSIIHAQQPILQAALLSTYFDNPCGETCDSSIDETITTIRTTASNETTFTTSRPESQNETINETFNDTLSQILEDIKDLERNTTIQKDLFKDEEVFTYETTESDEITPKESGSGSGDESLVDELITSDIRTEISTQASDIITKTNDSTSLLQEIENKMKDVIPWKIFDFFKNKNNRSDEQIFSDIYNASNPEINSNNYEEEKVGSTPTQYSTDSVNETTNWTQSSESSPLTTISSSIKSTSSTKRPRFSFFGSAARAKCDDFNQTVCIEWSTDRLLRARLCCLQDMLGNDEESGFGCRHVNRNKCHRMLPVIKCCLKDVSQILESYYQSVSRPSRPRSRYNPKIE